MRYDEESRISVSLISKVGCKIEEMIENAEHSKWRAVGAREALLKHVDNLIAFAKAVDDELQKSIPDIETAELIKSWLFKAITATKNFADHYVNVELGIIGEISGHKTTHDLLQKLMKEIQEKERNLRESLKKGDIIEDESGNLIAKPGRRRPVGVHPGKSIKKIRLEKEKPKSDNGVDLDTMTQEQLESYLLGE